MSPHQTFIGNLILDTTQLGVWGGGLALKRGLGHEGPYFVKVLISPERMGWLFTGVINTPSPCDPFHQVRTPLMLEPHSQVPQPQLLLSHPVCGIVTAAATD